MQGTLDADQYNELCKLRDAEAECEDQVEALRLRFRMRELYTAARENAFDEMGHIAREAGLLDYEKWGLGYAWAGTLEQIQAAIDRLPAWASGNVLRG